MATASYSVSISKTVHIDNENLKKDLAYPNKTYILIQKHLKRTTSKVVGTMYLVPKVSEIRTRRLDAGLSHHSLSKTAGLGGQAINRIESGETSSVHPLRAREIAKALHCKVEDIFIVKKGG